MYLLAAAAAAVQSMLSAPAAILHTLCFGSGDEISKDPVSGLGVQNTISGVTGFGLEDDAAFAAKFLSNYCNPNKDWGPIATQSNKSNSSPNFEVKQLALLFRHGARVRDDGDQIIDRCWANDVAEWDCSDVPEPRGHLERAILRNAYDDRRNSYRGSCALGQLTKDGYAMEMNNGKRVMLTGGLRT